MNVKKCGSPCLMSNYKKEETLFITVRASIVISQIFVKHLEPVLVYVLYFSIITECGLKYNYKGGQYMKRFIFRTIPIYNCTRQKF